MPTINPRVNEYIATIAPWQQSILKKFRALIHQACPDVVESIKWSRPAFEYKGVLCGMSGFKHYCSLGFWRENVLKELPGIDLAVLEAVGKVHEDAKFPSNTAILKLLHEAVRLNEENIKAEKPAARPVKKPLEMPVDFEKALRAKGAARAAFENFSPSAQREYLMWLADAKTEATRVKRLATAIEWIAEGKQRHWKYQTNK